MLKAALASLSKIARTWCHRFSEKPAVQSSLSRLRSLLTRLAALLAPLRNQLAGSSAALKPVVLVFLAMLGSGVAGYYWRGDTQVNLPVTEIPASFSALGNRPAESDRSLGADIQVSVQELGRLRAEIVRLRTLFARLAEVAQIQDSEFDVDLDIEESGFFEPLTPIQQQSGLKIDSSRLNSIQKALYKLDGSSSMLSSLFEQRRMTFDQRLSGRPLVGGQVTSRYGYRADPIHGKSNLHRGVDFVAEVGTPVLAMADGIVMHAGEQGAYGNLVELQHVNGYRSRYAHNASVTVQPGQRVSKGEAIATLGSTGRSTGPHVHLEVHLDGRPVDPMLFVR